MYHFIVEVLGAPYPQQHLLLVFLKFYPLWTMCSGISLCVGFFFFKDFIYLFERDRDSQRESEHKQGEWERKKQAPTGAGSPMWAWAKGRCLTTEPPRRPKEEYLIKFSIYD